MCGIVGFTGKHQFYWTVFPNWNTEDMILPVLQCVTERMRQKSSKQKGALKF